VTDIHLTLRKAEGGAAQGVASDLLRRYFAEEGLAVPPSRLRAGLDALLNDRRCVVLFAEREGVAGPPLGIVTASWSTSVERLKVAEISALYVVPAERGGGVAGALVEAVADWARTQGCTALFAAVGPDGELSHGTSGFFTHRGFADEYRKLLALDLTPGNGPVSSEEPASGEEPAPGDDAGTNADNPPKATT
jgi:GNAT superfamily N-acetyltransferase